MDGHDRRATRTILEYWPLIVVAVSGIVAAITFWNNVKDVIADQKAFKATVDSRKEVHQHEMEDIRVRLAKLEQWKTDREGKWTQ